MHAHAAPVYDESESRAQTPLAEERGARCMRSRSRSVLQRGGGVMTVHERKEVVAMDLVTLMRSSSSR